MIVAPDPAHDRSRSGPTNSEGNSAPEDARKSTSRGDGICRKRKVTRKCAREPASAGSRQRQALVATVVADHGMFVHGTVDAWPVQFLVDTGSAVSLLSESLAFDLGITAEDLSPLEQEERYCGAGGQPLRDTGSGCSPVTDTGVLMSPRHESGSEFTPLMPVREGCAVTDSLCNCIT